MMYHLMRGRLSRLLREIGKRKAGRDSVSRFILMQSKGGEIIFDLTHMFSDSENVMDAEYGWNSEGVWSRQVRVGVVRSGERIASMEHWQGSSREIQIIKALMERLKVEGKGKEKVLVSDRGIASYELAKEFDCEGIKFVMPLRKNFGIVDYGVKSEGVFKYQRRAIGYNVIECEIEGRKMKVYLFWDAELEGKKKAMWFSKWESGEANREDVEDRMDKCGKIAILSNTDLEPMEIYSIYKSRMCIEETIKRLKGYLHLDRTYMQSDEALDGWLFITMLSLQCHYWIIERLAESGLLRKYSVIDVMWELRKIRKEPWIDGWHLRPLTRKQRTIIEKLNLKEVIGIKWGVWGNKNAKKRKIVKVGKILTYPLFLNV